MALCRGKRADKSGTCGSLIYQCKKCGGVGCDSTVQKCSNQGFKGGRCMKCGVVGQKTPLK